MVETTNPPADWRGVPITVGRTCVYGAPVGRSIALVEAEVIGFTGSGRVTLRPVRRAYGSSARHSGARDTVHVGADRLTIVDALPPSELPTEAELAQRAAAERAERERLLATHDVPEYQRGEPVGARTCSRCGRTPYEAALVACGEPDE